MVWRKITKNQRRTRRNSSASQQTAFLPFPPLLRQASLLRLGSGPCSDFLPLLISNSLHPLWLDPPPTHSTFWGPFQHPHILPHTFPCVLHSGISTFAASFSAPASPCESPALSQTCLLRGAPSSHDQLKFWQAAALFLAPQPPMLPNPCQLHPQHRLQKTETLISGFTEQARKQHLQFCCLLFRCCHQLFLRGGSKTRQRLCKSQQLQHLLFA